MYSFRSHRRTALDLDARPVAIHGPNGAGKTNLIEAVSMLSPGRGLRRAAADELMRRPDPIGWRVAAEVAGHEIGLRAEPGQSRAVRIDGKAAPQAALGTIVPMLWLVPSMDRLWIEGAEGRRRFLDRMTLSFVPDHGEAVLTYEKAMRERNRLLRDQVRDPTWYGALERQMAEAGVRIIANRYQALNAVSRAQAQGATAFPVSDLDITEPEEVFFGTDALADSRRRDLMAGRTLVGPHRADLAAIYRAKGVPAAQCSTGEQKALLISLILANARAVRDATGRVPVLLLDEVAAHLDAARRAALYDEICALGAQAWMTGTSADLFAGLEDRAQAIEIQEVDGVSEVAR
ncbi:RecF [Oceaniovalibus guishaninsula JLT2003]|uniref:DNA replication and repair protein RecF n=1 Tax=Oceaniovalibus guishaninsula JLT2003 TaxID=1231392 RepID=K2HAV2_9RHOB|nr:RecF [Oceaniovalibus guishaninsula JLT2003]